MGLRSRVPLEYFVSRAPGSTFPICHFTVELLGTISSLKKIKYLLVNELIQITMRMVFRKSNSVELDIIFNPILIPHFSGSRFFRVQVFQGPGISGSMFF